MAELAPGQTLEIRLAGSQQRPNRAGGLAAQELKSASQYRITQ